MELDSNVLQVQPTDYRTCVIAPYRNQDLTPCMYRLANLPNGEMVLQGAYRWYEGFDKCGFDWKAVPTFALDENGKDV